MAVSPDAQKAGMTDEQWTALTEEQRIEKRKQFAATTPVVTAPVTVVQAGPAQPARPAQSAQSAQPGQPPRAAAPVVQTDAQHAGMTDAQWNALTETQKAERRAQFTDPLYRTDAQRAGMTQSQWNRMTPAEQSEFRARFPEIMAPPASGTTLSPPDLRGRVESHSPPWEQPYVPPVPTEAERVAAAKRDPNEPDPADSLAHLPNAHGGRNNPTLSNFDPLRKPTE
jgi:hypothetical protein